jgi:hypothetical protein
MERGKQVSDIVGKLPPLSFFVCRSIHPIINAIIKSTASALSILPYLSIDLYYNR